MQSPFTKIAVAAVCSLTLSGAFMQFAPAKTTKPAAKTSKVKWLTSHKEALAQAKKTGKPILIDFNAEWCGPCHMLRGELDGSKAFAAEAKNWVLLDIDVDKHPDLAKHYSVGPLPSLFALNAKGRVATKFEGYLPGQMTKWIQDARKKAVAKK
jgi:thioredoxin-like negative regulator of GroEL